jgi:iron(III) transport system permease protein
MTVTDLLSVRTYAEEAYIQFGLGKGPSAAAAVALPPLLFLGAFVTLGARSLLRSDPARLASAASRAKLWRLGAWRTAVGVLAGAVVAALVGLPFVSLVWHAGRVGGRASAGRLPHWSFGGLIGSLEYAWADASEPLIQSTLLGAAAATLSVALAWALAWASRGPGPWRWVTAGSVALALAAPGPVAGMALFLAYRPMLALYDSPAILILAGVLRTFPYALLVLWPAVRSIPVEFLDAAAVDGLGPAGIVTRVALPVTRGATVAAWGVAFVLSLGELPATNLVAPPGLMPLSVVIWLLLHNGIESRLAAIVLIMLAAVAAAGLFALASLRFLVKDEPKARGE